MLGFIVVSLKDDTNTQICSGFRRMFPIEVETSRLVWWEKSTVWFLFVTRSRGIILSNANPNGSINGCRIYANMSNLNWLSVRSNGSASRECLFHYGMTNFSTSPGPNLVGFSKYRRPQRIDRTYLKIGWGFIAILISKENKNLRFKRRSGCLKLILFHSPHPPFWYKLFLVWFKLTMVLVWATFVLVAHLNLVIQSPTKRFCHRRCIWLNMQMKD